MKKYVLIYKIAFFLSSFLVNSLRYFFYRKAVIEPSNLKLLYESEKAFHLAVKKNKPITKIVDNKRKRIGFLGQLSQSMLLNKDFWDFPIPENIDLYLYELNAKGYPINPKLKKFNHNLFEAFWHKSKFDRVYTDTFDYKKIARKINEDEIDLLIVTIETIGRFTYAKLFDEVITSTKIIVTNPGNYFYVHPKIYGQGQIQLPPCWTINNHVLKNSDGYSISDYKFFPKFFFYDRRDVLIEKNTTDSFNNTIFIHGRLSLVANKRFLKVIEKLLIDDTKRKLYLMGINDLNSLSFIEGFFSKANLKSQFEYLGHFYMNFSENGKIENKNWEITKKLLKTSGVFLNPFPKGAGSARMEAFLSGLPVIDLEIDFMDPKQKSNKEYILEPLIKKYGTAFSEEEYYSLATKCLKDKNYRKKIIKEQYEFVDEFFDESFFWEKIIKML